MDTHESPKTPLSVGAIVSYQDEVWRVAGIPGDGTIEILRAGDSNLKAVRESMVVAFGPLPKSPLDSKAMEDLPEEKVAKGRERLVRVLEFLNSPMTAEDVKVAAATAQVHETTFRNWVDRYVLSGGKFSVLVPYAGRYGNTNHRLRGRTKEILQEVIQEEYLSAKRLRPGRVWKKAKTRCEKEGAAPPGRATVYRRLRDLPGEEVIKTRVGKRAAREQFRPHEKRATTGDFPLHVIQMDHTKLDIFVKLGEGLALRPWITVAIDTYSRMIVGFYLSFDTPNTLAVALCLYRVMRPKEDWLETMGILSPWPATGRPYVILVDNGKEFRSHHLQDVALEHQIIIQFRPVKEPEYGAFIERLMGTLALEMEVLPGATFRELALRKHFDPEVRACLTLDQLEKALLYFFVEKYHHGPHRGLGDASPISRWREGWAGMDLADPLRQHVLIDPSTDLLLSLLPGFDRTVQQDGVHWKCIRYFDHALVPYIRNRKVGVPSKQYRFRYDPRNIRFIYLKDPQTGQLLRIPARDTGWRDVSEWEHDAQEADRAREAAKTIDHAAVARGEEGIASIVKEGEASIPKRRQKKASKGAKQEALKGLRAQGRTAASLGPDEIQTHLKFPLLPVIPEPETDWTDIPHFSSEDF